MEMSSQFYGEFRSSSDGDAAALERIISQITSQCLHLAEILENKREQIEHNSLIGFLKDCGNLIEQITCETPLEVTVNKIFSGM